MRVVTGMWLAALVALALPVAPVGAASLYTEEYAAGDAGWRDGPTNAVGSLAWSASGGVDGSSYVTGNFNYQLNTPTDNGPVLFRGPASASGGNFFGDWFAAGVLELSFHVRHDAGVPVTFYARIAAPPGNGAAITQYSAAVPSGEWTKLSWTLTEASFQSFSGGDYNSIFGVPGVSIFQVAAQVPVSLAGVDQVVHYDLDKVAITPEPAAAALVALALGVGGLTRRLGRR